MGRPSKAEGPKKAKKVKVEKGKHVACPEIVKTTTERS
jgi:hypothetical protein